ncbi:MAG TPA: transposase [Pyrinomonadaceae bacterium]|nr:transposase [Pyrinomonadaceae bacterium]
MLMQQLHSLLEQGWRTAFAQSRSHRRAMRHALALPCVLGRRTISRTLCALGQSQRDWSADYKMFSRCRWSSERLFEPVIDEYLQRFHQGPVAVAVDDTKVRKTGKKIKGASWQRDPLSPPFHLNFLYGLRFLQASLLFPHYREGDFPPRGIPVRFQEAPPLKKPGKRASDEELQQYRQLKKEKNLSTQTLEVIRGLRASLDQRGGDKRLLLVAGDGSFCNRTMFKAQLERVAFIARCRKDARLCFPAPTGQRRKYDQQVFTPEQVRQQPDRHWQRARVYLGGKRRLVKYKEVPGVLWKRGGATRKLRLIVIAPVPYKLSKYSRTNYRQPAYFLSTALLTESKRLVQTCFDRWQIEVNHRDEKDILGVGQAQVRAEQSVPRHPALAVASYSMLLLAALQSFGPGRTADYPLHPKWRKVCKRPSFLDIVTLLRRDSNEASVSSFLHQNFAKNLIAYADT